jgi:hypothetical protein
MIRKKKLMFSDSIFDKKAIIGKNETRKIIFRNMFK